MGDTDLQRNKTEMEEQKFLEERVEALLWLMVGCRHKIEMEYEQMKIIKNELYTFYAKIKDDNFAENIFLPQLSTLCLADLMIDNCLPFT